MIKIAKFLLRCLLRLLYRVDVKGMEHYHEAGNRVLIVANHTSLLDGLLLYAWLPETPTFAINTEIAQKKTFKFFLMFVDLFISSARLRQASTRWNGKTQSHNWKQEGGAAQSPSPTILQLYLLLRTGNEKKKAPMEHHRDHRT